MTLNLERLARTISSVATFADAEKENLYPRHKSDRIAIGV
jgi:hypothetical protein